MHGVKITKPIDSFHLLVVLHCFVKVSTLKNSALKTISQLKLKLYADVYLRLKDACNCLMVLRCDGESTHVCVNVDSLQKFFLHK